MTTLTDQCRRGSLSLEPGERMVFAWEISPQAASAARLCESPAPVRLEIEAPWPGCRGPLRARIVGEQNGSRSLPPYFAGGVEWISDDASELLHMEAEGFLRATVRLSEAGVEVLYARTGLLQALGIGGGRYELAATRAPLDRGNGRRHEKPRS